MKQISLHVSDRTAAQIVALAARYGLPVQRHNTPVIALAVERLYNQEIERKEGPADETQPDHRP